jgi:hypothetical protein
MSPLAQLIYTYLVSRLLADPQSWVNYRQIALHLRPQLRLSWRGGAMHAALGELVEWCQIRGIGAIPAIVIRAVDGHPGRGFFPIAFPGIADQRELLRLWEQEVEYVRQTVYPLAP